MSDSPKNSAPPAGYESDALVCFCHCKTVGEILAAIRNGAKTVGDIQEATKASTGCGGCQMDVQALLDAELKRASQAGE